MVSYFHFWKLFVRCRLFYEDDLFPIESLDWFSAILFWSIQELKVNQFFLPYVSKLWNKNKTLNTEKVVCLERERECSNEFWFVSDAFINVLSRQCESKSFLMVLVLRQKRMVGFFSHHRLFRWWANERLVNRKFPLHHTDKN